MSNIRADYLGEQLTIDSVRRSKLLIWDYLEAGWIQKPVDYSPTVSKDTLSINADGSQTHEGKYLIDDENKLRNPEYLLRLHKYDPNQWELISGKHSIWDVQKKDGLIKTLFSSKITTKPKKKAFDFNKIKQWYDGFESKKVEVRKYQIDKCDQNCLVLPIADLHFNLLSTAFISGNEYNKQIAKDNFYKIVCDVIDRVKNKNITKTFLILGNDMFNANGINGTTFKGTPQNEEGHIFEAYIELSEIVANAIKTLYEELSSSIDVIFVPSNHDKEISFYFMYNLYTLYRNDDNVTVDYSPLPRKYRRFGKTLFMFSHDV